MSGTDNESLSTTEGETGWIEADADVIDWMDAVAMCYGITTRDVAERFLRHGVKNYEDIL